MSLLYQCLSADDLKELTEEDLEMLQRIIEHELHTSTGIKRILIPLLSLWEEVKWNSL